MIDLDEIEKRAKAASDFGLKPFGIVRNGRGIPELCDWVRDAPVDGTEPNLYEAETFFNEASDDVLELIAEIKRLRKRILLGRTKP